MEEITKELTEKELKKDEGKLRLDLYPTEALESVTEIIQFGTKKYAERSWEKGMRFSRLYAACLRHLIAWWNRKELDDESGYTHLAHATCCLVFLLTYQKRNMSNFDDRPKKIWN